MNEDTSRVGLREPERRRFGSHELWYLAFLVFMFLPPSFNPEAGGEDWVLAAVISAITAVVYLASFRRGRHQILAASILMSIAVVGTWLGTSAMGVLPIYAAAILACEGDRPQVVRRLAAVTAVTALSIPLSEVPFPYLLLMYVPALGLIWLVGLSVFEDVSLTRDRDRLRADNARIEYLATVTERERIARDLHDLAGQALTAVTLRSQLVQRLADADPARVRQEAAAIEETARQTLSSLRETVAGWQQVDLEDELSKATDALAAAGVTPEIEGDWKRDLAPSVETVLALALREGVTNVVRHARASTCRISLDGPSGEVVLSISDDGVGSDRAEGSGLRGMRERVTAAGGLVERTADRPGTGLRVAIPVASP